ncbi:Serine/threonine-protein kinase rio2 [Clarireedia jacksonii]
MKLDTKAMRYLTAEDWRTLTAVEQGSKNHEVVPTPLIAQLSGLRGGVHRCISALAKVNLIARLKNAKYDGYRLTYGGLDYLALNTYRKRKDVYSVGNQIGVGKESDIFVVADEKGVQRVLKIHRLGRISFRTVKANRDYLRHRSSASWMHMSRLAALKEYTFMQALRENGFPVPEPLAQSRHTIVMSLIDAFPMRQISSVPDPASLYAELISMILRLAQCGLIHGDFNEFNILIKEETNPDAPESPVILTPILIDFPQMVSIDHTNAEYYFDRDVNCIKRFFERRFHFTSNEKGPYLADARKLLDVSVEASGFSRKMAKELENYMKAVGVDGDGEPGAERGDEDEDEDEEEEEEDEDEEEHDEDEGDAEDNKGGEHTDDIEIPGDLTGIEENVKTSNDDVGEASMAHLKIEEKT